MRSELFLKITKSQYFFVENFLVLDAEKPRRNKAHHKRQAGQHDGEDGNTGLVHLDA